MDQDTSSAQRKRYIELLQRLSPAQRLRKAAELSRAVRVLAEAGIRQRHPKIAADELRVRLTARIYGRAVAERLYGVVPDDVR